MVRCGLAHALAGFCLLLASAQVQAQVVNGSQWPLPRLTLVSPCGGKVGTSFELTASATDADVPEGLHFNHPGIKGVLVAPPSPMADPAKAVAKKTEVLTTKFTVSIAEDVPPGFYDVRLVNKWGVSNPRVFVVGSGEEVVEKEPNNDVEQAQRIELGTTIHGSISTPTDVDFAVFAGKKGQRILVHAQTAGVDSRLNPEIRMLDPKGRYLWYERILPQSDGVLDVTLPEDGDYLVRFNQFTYTAGGPEFFYRLRISTGPWLDAVFPSSVEPGRKNKLTLYGRNLPGGQPAPEATLDGDIRLEKLTVEVDAPNTTDRLTVLGVLGSQSALVDGFEYRLESSAGLSNPLLLSYARAPVVAEDDRNDTPEAAQRVEVPCEIAGRVDKKRDRDWYTFEAKKGQVFTVDLLSHRLGARADMYFSLRNAKTKAEVAQADDSTDNVSLRMFTLTRDPAPVRFVVPEDGTYQVLAASHTGENQADVRHGYVLRIAAERPDFQLVVMPADEVRPDCASLGKGGRVNFTVFAQRLDGFKGDIALSMEGLPPGVSCPPQVLGRAAKATNLVITADPDAPPFTGAVRVVGTAEIDGKTVRHEARPASITWAVQPQQNIPTITRLDRELMLAVREQTPGKLTAGKERVVVAHGDKVEIPLKIDRLVPEFKDKLQVAPLPSDLPATVTFAAVSVDDKGATNVSLTIPATAPVGPYNLVFRGFAPMPLPSAKGKNSNIVLVSNPVELVIVPKQVAALSLENASVKAKVGSDVQVTVKAARQFDFAEALKVELILPDSVQGLKAEPAVIAPNASETRLTVRVAPDAEPRMVDTAVVRVTGTFLGMTITQETKLTLNLSK